jgi:diguanylate cyclase (GGDEF)-like protein
MMSPTPESSVETAKSSPISGLLLSLAALVVPAVSLVGGAPVTVESNAILVWMTPLLPGFLLTYHRGWAGAALTLATGMASLAVGQVVCLLLGAEPPAWPYLFGVVVVYLFFAFGIGILAEVLRRERDAARRMALTDELTGLPNRRHGVLFLEAAFARAQRGDSLAVVLFDLDHFKGFNDRWGHAAGDRVLSAFGKLLGRSMRKSDLAVRWGGEEFLAILTMTEAAGARVFARRVREKLKDLRLPYGEVTVSGGLARFRRGMADTEALLGLADLALYQAKTMGRDQVRGDPTTEDEEAPGFGSFFAGSARGRAVPVFAPVAPLRIAVVENDPTVAQGLERALGRPDLLVSAYLDPMDLLAQVDGGGAVPDLLLTDLVLPGMNGPELLEGLRKRGVRPVVAYIAGDAWADSMGRSSFPQGPVFLEKAVTLETLGSTVRDLFEDVEGQDGSLNPEPLQSKRA